MNDPVFIVIDIIIIALVALVIRLLWKIERNTRKVEPRVVLQQLLPDKIVLTYSDGTTKEIPYLLDENGQRYASLDPNQDVLPGKDRS